MRAYLLVQACPHFSADAASRDASFKPPSALPQVYGLKSAGPLERESRHRSALEVEVRIGVLVALDDGFAAERMQLVFAGPQLDATDLAGDRLRQLGEL